MTKPLRIVGINFDHFHMGDLLRMAHDHPEVELVGICDEQQIVDSAVQSAEQKRTVRIVE